MATTGELYSQAYMSTHEQLFQQSIKLAEKEFVTLAERIQELEGKIADYERALATGYTTGTKSTKNLVSESEVSGRIRLQEQREQNKRDEIAAVNSSAERSFDIMRYNMPDVRNTMEANLRAGKTVASTVDAAINNVGGKGAGKDQLQRYVLGKSLLQAAKNAADTQGKTYTEQQLRTQIATGLGIDANAMLLSDEALKNQVTKPKIDAIEASYAAMPEIPGIQRITSEEDRGKIEAEKTAAEEKLGILEQQMKDQYGDDVDLGKIIERGREIYSQQYAPLTREQRRSLRKTKTVENLSPVARMNYEAYQLIQSGDERVQGLFSADFDDDQTTKAARQIISAKEAGRDTDVRALAKSLTDNDEQALEALGIAMRYFEANAKRGKIEIPKPDIDPTTKPADQTDAQAAIDEAAKEQGVSLGAIQRMAQKVGAIDFMKDTDIDELFSNRIFEPKTMPTTPEIEAMIEPKKPAETVETKVEQTTTPVEVTTETPAETPTVEDVEFDERGGIPVPTGPEFNKTYYKANNPKDFGYQFIDANTVTFVKKDGKKVGKFDKDSAQYKEAMEFYQQAQGGQ